MKKINFFFKPKNVPKVVPSDPKDTNDIIEFENQETENIDLRTTLERDHDPETSEQPLTQAMATCFESESETQAKKTTCSTRTYQPKREKLHSWIKYDKFKNVVFCHHFIKAVDMKMPLPKNSRENDSF